ncbi:hypothetical protein PTTG_27160 [Puccinia triticina 1-1 BBBD Race 1]|uniref:DNA 3'-5' helicase n=1 Tax=Puccinia triticina (isolate 1-1 / race 1 (BBBD)) TaxID=630390 RepID=A0A180GLZ4_PUCT1|nr:hypothetical protein PTTG_27160 [Puccinia triticina 1-1 BBBD Race 1]
MKSSLKSCDDLLQLYGPRSCVPNKDIIPTLIYSTTRNLTMQASKVIHKARRIPGGHGDANSTFAQRFHACSGEVSKEETTSQFAAGEFPVISCTMALGLGQNWKRVRSVVHVGRGDPASICQMIGRCGRGGSNGLAILFVEPNRRSGKNSVEEFTTPTQQTDDERMDALAITPVCLQVCFAIDNKVGYIPLSIDDPNVIQERARQQEMEFPTCECSNCEPTKVASVLDNYRKFRTSTFDQYMKTGEDLPDDPQNTTHVRVSQRPNYRLGSTKTPLAPALEELADQLLEEFGRLFEDTFDPDTAEVHVEQMFEIQQARSFSLAVKRGLPLTEITRIIGGEMIDGQMVHLQKKVVDVYCAGSTYQDYIKGNNTNIRKRKNTEDASKSQKAPTKAKVERERKRLKWVDDQVVLEQFKRDNAERIREKNTLIIPQQTEEAVLVDGEASKSNKAVLADGEASKSNKPPTKAEISIKRK